MPVMLAARGLVGGGWRNAGQLMLMMLAAQGWLEKRRANDADDACCARGGWRNAGQLTFIMLAAQGVVGETQGS